jgi:hypothetical protein
LLLRILFAKAAEWPARRSNIQDFVNLDIALRKISAILLLALLLFNWVGYRLFSAVLQYRADVQLEARMDKNDYDDSELIEIKIALNLPYQLNWKSFERFDGEVDVDGIHYKYVKRKIYNDSLVLLCLPNKSKQHLEKAKDEYFKVVNDIDASSQNNSHQNHLTFKNILTEFFVEQPFWLNNHFECVQTKHVVRNTLLVSAILPGIPGQPPDGRLLTT